VFVPFVLPEGLVSTAIVFPVLLHECESALASGTGSLENAGDIVVLTTVITVLSVRAIAEVRPEAVDSPGVGRASSWLGVPELNLKNLSLDFCAASVLDSGRVLAAQGRVERADGGICNDRVDEPEGCKTSSNSLHCVVFVVRY